MVWNMIRRMPPCIRDVIYQYRFDPMKRVRMQYMRLVRNSGCILTDAADRQTRGLRIRMRRVCVVVPQL